MYKGPFIRRLQFLLKFKVGCLEKYTILLFFNCCVQRNITFVIELLAPPMEQKEALNQRIIQTMKLRFNVEFIFSWEQLVNLV